MTMRLGSVFVVRSVCGFAVGAIGVAALAAPPEPGVVYDDAPWADQSCVRLGDGQGDGPFFRAANVNGPDDELLDIVFVGDGYTASEQGQFVTDASNAANLIFAYEPFISYLPFIEFHFVEVVSNDSGVDNDPVQGIVKDTALDMGFWCGGTERALCVSTSKARSAAFQGAGPFDVVVALANTSKYGGVGYPSLNVATSSARNAAAGDIVIHELGHALGDLADEYRYGGPTAYTGFERPEENVSIYPRAEMVAQNRKWTRWMDATEPGFDGPVDTFEGGFYSETGVYRPTDNSMMRALGRPFNLPSAEALIIAIHDATAMITSASPGPAGGVSLDDVLSIGVIEAAAPMYTRWLVEGEVRVEGFGLYSMDLSAGVLGPLGDRDEVSVEVVDMTPWVRDEDARADEMTETHEWTVVLPACNAADVAVPFGVLDQSDVDQFLLSYTLNFPSADIAAPFGVFDLADVDAFVIGYLGGCP